MALTDLTRISTSGIATGSTIDSPILRKDVSLRGSQVGVTSVLFDSSEDELKFNDNVKLIFGDYGDLNLYHTGSHSYVQDTGAGNLILDTNGFAIKLTYNDSDTMLRAIRNQQVELFYDNDSKFQTTKHGASVTGILTATGFSGPVVGNTSNSSGISTFYDLRVTNNLTVEGTTTTLDTDLTAVDRIEVGANSNSVVGIAVTQSGTADIVNLFDGGTEIVKVASSTNAVKVTHSGGYGLRVQRGSKFLDFNGDWATSGNTAINAGASGIRFYYGDSSDGIQFNTGSGDDKVRIKSDGKVGIGTTNPQAKLEVVGDGTFDDIRVGEWSHSADYAGVFHKNQTGQEYMILSRDENTFLSATTGHDVVIRGGGNVTTNQIRVHSDSGVNAIVIDGKTIFNNSIGIGTDNPNVIVEVLDDSPALRLSDNNSSAGANSYTQLTNINGNTYVYTRANSSNGSYLIGGQGGGTFDEFVRITSSGKIGIGTGNPVGKLHIWSTGPDILLTDSNQATDNRNWILTGANTQILRLQAQNDSYAGGGNLFDFYRSGNNINELRGMKAGNYWFVVNNSTKRVGIGTDNPTYVLHTFNDGAVGSAENSRKYNGRFTTYTPNRLNLDIYDRRWQDTQTHGWEGTEKRLEYNVDDNTSKRMWMSFFNPDNAVASNVIRFGEQEDTEWMRIYDGNVGINSTNPNSKLTVASGSATAQIEIQRTNGSGGGTIGALNFTAVTGYSVANISAVGQGNNDGAHLVFRTTDSAGEHSPFGGSTNEHLRITSEGKIGIATATPTAKLTIGRVTGGYMNMGGIQVNRPHSLGLQNGVLVYTDAGYNNTATYRAAAFKAVGTSGIAFAVSTDAGNNGLGGTLNAKIDFDGDAHFLGNTGIGTNSPLSRLDVRNASGTNPLLSLHHSNADVEGEVIRIGRTDIPTIRYHSIKAKHSGGAASNYISVNVHDGGSSPYTGQTEVARFLGAGGMTFNGDTATANALDDYEEGSWTPTVVSEGTIGTPQYTCTYTKIGRLVTINADIAHLTDTTSNTNIKIGGLPYVPSGTSANWSAVCHGERYGHKDVIVAYIVYNSGAWGINFRYGVPLNHYSYVKHSNISDDGTDNNLRFTLTYEVA